MQRLSHLLLACCAALFFLASCGSTSKNQGSKLNKPVLYNPASSKLNPKLGVFHVSDAESQLYIMLSTSDLLISEANQERIPKSEIMIHYQLFDCTELENNKTVSDSSTFINSFEIRQQQKIIVFPIMIPAEQGRRYMLLVQITDLLRRNTIKQFLTVNKTDVYSAQNFRLIALNGSPKLENTISENELFRIAYQRKPVDKLYIKYMSASQPMAVSPLAPAPSSVPAFKADSMWTETYSPNINFMFGYEGLYLIQTDTTQQSGLLLMNFGPSYPAENRTEQLVQPIQYIATNVEYQRLSAEQQYPKKMMDNFWLATTGSTDKARMLIRVFYTRMAYANQFFTDYKEGWKTDRGMIYLIYGLPNNINKGSNSETWEYTRKQQSPLTFTFERKPLPFCEDHFVLRRGDAQPTFWRQAVDSWRKGRVFSMSDLD